MKIASHPAFDNPVRMGYVPGWRNINDLIERLGDLEQAVGKERVIPARWEPYFDVCPSYRSADAYALARTQIQNPYEFAQALALFPGPREQLDTRIGHANWLMLCTKSEPSAITRRLMFAEALEEWKDHATDWLESVVKTCATSGSDISLDLLHQQVQQVLQRLAKETPPDGDGLKPPHGPTGFQKSHGFDKELLHLDGWTPDPGLIILPVDGKSISLTRQILRLDQFNIVLHRGGKAPRVVAWEKVTLVHLFDGEVTFEILDEPPLVVAGYRHPEAVLTVIEGCYKAATERLLQAVAAQVVHTTP